MIVPTTGKLASITQNVGSTPKCGYSVLVSRKIVKQCSQASCWRPTQPSVMWKYILPWPQDWRSTIHRVQVSGCCFCYIEILMGKTGKYIHTHPPLCTVSYPSTSAHMQEHAQSCPKEVKGQQSVRNKCSLSGSKHTRLFYVPCLPEKKEKWCSRSMVDQAGRLQTEAQTTFTQH